MRDGTTFRLEKKDYPILYKDDLKYFNRILVLTDGNMHVVGGVLFYSNDIQVTILPKYRGHGYMSAIHKNGILQEECNNEGIASVSLEFSELNSMDDFLLRRHMLSYTDLDINNLDIVYDHL